MHKRFAWAYAENLHVCFTMIFQQCSNDKPNTKKVKIFLLEFLSPTQTCWARRGRKQSWTRCWRSRASSRCWLSGHRWPPDLEKMSSFLTLPYVTSSSIWAGGYPTLLKLWTNGGCPTLLRLWTNQSLIWLTLLICLLQTHTKKVLKLAHVKSFNRYHYVSPQ